VQRPKIIAERDSVVAASAITLIAPLNQRIAALSDHVDELVSQAEDNTERITSLEEELGMVRLWAQVLWRQVVELGGEPIAFGQIEEAWQTDTGA
jgi:hypothetical protein